MGLLDEMREEQAGRRGGLKCHACRIIDGEAEPQLDDQTRLDFTEALADYSISVGTIVAVMRRRGVDLTENKVGHHRREHER